MSHVKKALRSKKTAKAIDNFLTITILTGNVHEGLKSMKDTAKQNGALKKLVQGSIKDLLNLP